MREGQLLSSNSREEPVDSERRHSLPLQQYGGPHGRTGRPACGGLWSPLPPFHALDKATIPFLQMMCILGGIRDFLWPSSRHKTSAECAHRQVRRPSAEIENGRCTSLSSLSSQGVAQFGLFVTRANAPSQCRSGALDQGRLNGRWFQLVSHPLLSWLSSPASFLRQPYCLDRGTKKMQK